MISSFHARDVIPELRSISEYCGVYESLDIEFGGEQFEAHPLKALWHKASASLICSDIHIGKAAHFRKSGIAIPTLANDENAWNLQSLLQHYPCKRLVVVGDILHSHSNEEWLRFVDFLDQFPEVQRLLVAGNHDRFGMQALRAASFDIVPTARIGSVVLLHEPPDQLHEPTLCGHLHPAVSFRGKARQHLRLPCFYFGQQLALLPAFGSFTGTATIKPSAGDRVVVIANGKLMQVPVGTK